MLKTDVDRICVETLQGRFGPRLLPARRAEAFAIATARPAMAAVEAASIFSAAAVWTSTASGRRPGIEQGKL